MKCKENSPETPQYRFCYMLAFMSSSLFSFGLSVRATFFNLCRYGICGKWKFLSNNPVIIVTMELFRK